MDLSIKQISNALECESIVAPSDESRIVTSITWDSRNVEPGGAFLAIIGERVDGNSFIKGAIEDGAVLAIASRTPDEDAISAAVSAGAAIIMVSDPTNAMQALAACQRDQLGCEVVSVTGSSGKTTTKDIIATVLGSAFATVATAANRNNELGVPATVLESDASTQALVVEIGMRGFHQLESLCAFVKPRIGVITNIGTAHEELLGSQENIAKAKSELIAALPEGEGIAILNGDDPFTEKVIAYSKAIERNVSVVTYGVSEECDVRASNIVFSEDGRPAFDIVFPDSSEGHVSLMLMGAHNVSNALAAAAVGFTCGIAPETICSALELAQSGSMRQEICITESGIKIINDAYNANPDSAAAALRLLSLMRSDGRKIAVLGDMLELGDSSETLHADTGKLAASLGVDVLVAVGELGAHIAQGARIESAGNLEIHEFADAQEALDGIRPMLSCGDVVLIKASRGMQLEKIAKGLTD